MRLQLTHAAGKVQSMSSENSMPDRLTAPSRQLDTFTRGQRLAFDMAWLGLIFCAVSLEAEVCLNTSPAGQTGPLLIVLSAPFLLASGVLLMWARRPASLGNLDRMERAVIAGGLGVALIGLNAIAAAVHLSGTTTSGTARALLLLAGITGALLCIVGGAMTRWALGPDVN